MQSFQTGMGASAIRRLPPNRIDWRIGCATVLSVLLHFAVAWQVKPGHHGSVGFRPLQVEIVPAAPEVHEPLTNPGPEPDTRSPEPVLDTPNLAAAKPAPAPAISMQESPAIPGLLADIYYRSREVDIRAEPVNQVDLIYPLAPFQKKIRGIVRLEIFVSAEGEIDKAVIDESYPPGLFDEAALNAVRGLKFSPAIKNGIPVKNRKTIEIVFDPYERFAKPTQSPDSSAAGK